MNYKVAQSMPQSIEFMGNELPVKWFARCASKQWKINHSIDSDRRKDVTDLVLESILIAYERQASLRLRGKNEMKTNSNGYLYGCVRNFVRDAARKQTRHAERECELKD